jgi:hypothetical protein
MHPENSFSRLLSDRMRGTLSMTVLDSASRTHGMGSRSYDEYGWAPERSRGSINACRNIAIVTFTIAEEESLLSSKKALSESRKDGPCATIVGTRTVAVN